MSTQELDPELRISNKNLPPLKKVASKFRLNTESPSDDDSQSGAVIKPKPRKGYQTAEYIKALEYFKSQAYTKKITDLNGQTQYKDLDLFSQTSQLEEYGLGVYLYLQFIKRLAAAFLIMTAFSVIPVIYAYINGTGLSAYKSSYTIELAKTSLGNLYEGELYGYLVFTVSDLLSMIVLFGFYLHWRSFHAEAVNNQIKDLNMLNPSHYTLSVVGFDPLTKNLQENLQKYITHIVTPQYVQKQYSMGYQQLPPAYEKPKVKIYEVEVMYNFNGYFSKFIEYDQLVEEKEKQRQLMIQTPGRTNQQFLKISKKITALEEQLSKISQVFQPYEAVIHFENIKARFDFINFQRRYSLFDNFSNSLKRFICCAPLPPRTHLFMQREALLIKSTQLSRPEQINWQNLDISGVSRVLRWIFSIIFLIVSIAITSSAIALCTLYVSSKSACSNFDVTTTLTKAQQSGGQLLYCYCAAHFTQIYTDVDIQTACSAISNTILYSNLMQVGASLVSSISNILLITAVSLISKFVLKPSSRPIQYSFTFVGVLLSNYINASILPLLMNGDIFGFQSLSYLKFIDFIDFSKVAIFRDYTTDWYAVVAPYYINFLIIAIVSPIINLVVTCLFDCFTKWRVKRACENVKESPIIQKQANKLLASNEFDLATQKAIVCLNFFISVMYSSLMPIMIPITTVYLIISFFCKKYIILRYSVRIPADAALSQKTINLIPFVILLHFLMGIWAHTAEDVFKDQSYVIKLNLEFVKQSSIIVQRAFIDILMLGGGALIVVWIIFDYTLIKFFTTVADCFKDEIEVPKQLASAQNKSFRNSLQSKNILGSYKLVNNPTCGHAMKAYQQLKKRKQKQMMRKSFNNTKGTLKQQGSPSPQKFGQQTMDSINLKNQQQINSINEILPKQPYRYQYQQE